MQREYNTKLKDEIMSYMQRNRDRRVSAYQINEYMKANNVKINITTIYRNLDKMTAAGKLLRVKSPEDDCNLYQYLDVDGECDIHLHVQCSKCGSIVHVNEEGMELIGNYLYDKCGYILNCKDSMIVGKCDKCRSKN